MTDDPPVDAAEHIAEVVEMLSRPRSYPHRPARVEHLQTHISHVFLAGSYVYKLKKAVRFPFLDFTTLAARRHFCAEELRLNRGLAAPIYLDVLDVVRASDATLSLGGPGAFVEPVLRMRRLPAERMLPVLLAHDAVDAGMMTALALRLVAFHREAPTGAGIAAQAAPAALAARCSETLEILRGFVGTIVRPEEHALVVDFAERFIRTHGALLERRCEEGRIREGHGDLHAEHVCFADARTSAADADAEAVPAGIYVFDCIEFSESFRCNDVASEIAFLAMDLEFRGRRDLADAFVDAYVAIADDPEIRVLLPYYAACRAGVRAVVAALTSREDDVVPAEREAARTRAQAYLDLATRFAWRAQPAAVIACCGLSGSGKSALAAELASATDFAWLRTDLIRKERDPGETAAERYSDAARTAVYERLTAEAERVLGAGRGVIVDATFLRRSDRTRLTAMAARQGRRLIFLETDAPEVVVRGRLAARGADDLSDARLETYLAQRRAREPFADDEEHLVVATDAPIAAVRGAAISTLWTHLRG